MLAALDAERTEPTFGISEDTSSPQNTELGSAPAGPAGFTPPGLKASSPIKTKVCHASFLQGLLLYCPVLLSAVTSLAIS
jgi:hypothetical protein